MDGGRSHGKVVSDIELLESASPFTISEVAEYLTDHIFGDIQSDKCVRDTPFCYVLGVKEGVVVKKLFGPFREVSIDEDVEASCKVRDKTGETFSIRKVMASLKKSARKSAVNPVKMDTNTNGVIELSVTVGYLASDVHKAEICLLERLLADHCDAGLVAIERGDLEQHLHFQMVCRARVNTARGFGVLVRKYMNWHGRKDMVPAGKVMCKVLTNRLIHTWKGMLGYCLKDSGATHFEVVMKNVSDEEVIAGKTLHSIYGKADLKQRVCLTTKNIGERCYVWYKYRESRQLTATFLSTLTDMVNSGLFIPAAQWIIPFTGQGMDQVTMNCYWKCLVDPTNVHKSDLAEIFVNTRDSYKVRYYAEEDDLVEPKEEKCDYTFEGTPATNTSSGLTSVARSIPRALGVELAASGDDRCGLSAHQVPARNVLDAGARRKLHFEAGEDSRSSKTVKIDPNAVPDFIPLKDKAVLPTYTYLPTTDALAGNLEPKGMSDDKFWEWLSSCKAAQLCSSSHKAKIVDLSDVTVNAGDIGADAVEEGVENGRRPHPMHGPIMLHEGIELIVLSDSEGEEEMPPVSYIVTPAVVSEDRIGSRTEFAVPHYSKIDVDPITVISAESARYKENSRN